MLSKLLIVIILYSVSSSICICGLLIRQGTLQLDQIELGIYYCYWIVVKSELNDIG